MLLLHQNFKIKWINVCTRAGPGLARFLAKNQFRWAELPCLPAKGSRKIGLPFIRLYALIALALLLSAQHVSAQMRNGCSEASEYFSRSHDTEPIDTQVHALSILKSSLNGPGEDPPPCPDWVFERTYWECADKL